MLLLYPSFRYPILSFATIPYFLKILWTYNIAYYGSGFSLYFIPMIGALFTLIFFIGNSLTTYKYFIYTYKGVTMKEQLVLERETPS